MRLVSVLCLLVAAIIRPHRARCPRGFWLDQGVRADGSFRCAQLPPEPIGDRDLAPANMAIESRVYCTGGTQPVVVDGVAVSCQRGGWM